MKTTIYLYLYSIRMSNLLKLKIYEIS